MPLPAILTRPCGQNAALAARLRAAGRSVLELPALRLAPSGAAVPDPAGFDLVMFVSGNAVRFYLDARGDAGWPLGVPAAVVGPASAAALRGHAGFGARPDIVQPAPGGGHFDSEALWAEIESLPALPRKVLIVRGGSGPQGSGRDWLAARLQSRGSDVVSHCAYLREPARWNEAARTSLAALAAAGPAIWLHTSKEGADAVHANAQALNLADWWRRCRLIATHPRIAQHLISMLSVTGPGAAVPPMLQTCSPRDDDIFAAIESVS